MSIDWLWPLSAVASFILTWIAARVAEKRRLLDYPNERSSHDRPVPRGGGIAIVATFLGGAGLAALSAVPDYRLLAAAAGGGCLVAAVGLADDWRDVPVERRLALHAVAAIWALYWAGGLPEGLLPGVPTMLVNGLGVLCTVWLINLYNFMDGIDGIAAIEALTVCLGGIILYAWGAPGGTAWVYPALLLATAAGFLVWNYPPARVFLGDTGSGFLGYLMAVFCIQAAHVATELFWAWMILLGAFIVDSGVTLGRRIWRRERLSVAHRSHAYQVAARRLGGHAPVSLAVGAINLFWLLPVAFFVATGRMPVVVALVIAYVPLVGLAVHFDAGAAGRRDPTSRR